MVYWLNLHTRMSSVLCQLSSLFSDVTSPDYLLYNESLIIALHMCFNDCMKDDDEWWIEMGYSSNSRLVNLQKETYFSTNLVGILAPSLISQTFNVEFEYCYHPFLENWCCGKIPWSDLGAAIDTPGLLATYSHIHIQIILTIIISGDYF